MRRKDREMAEYLDDEGEIFYGITSVRSGVHICGLSRMG